MANEKTVFTPAMVEAEQVLLEVSEYTDGGPIGNIGATSTIPEVIEVAANIRKALTSLEDLIKG